jgi:hypothetical protein
MATSFSLISNRREPVGVGNAKAKISLPAIAKP